MLAFFADMLNFLLYTVAAEFTFTPSAPIYVHESAVYHCSVSVATDDTVSIQWRVNDTSSSSTSFQSDIISLGITVNGIGTQDSTLIIPGDPQLNGTRVACIATGYINDNEVYLNISTSVLYIQGTRRLIDILNMYLSPLIQ